MATFDTRRAAEFDPLAPIEHVPGNWRTGLGPGLVGGTMMLVVLLVLSFARIGYGVRLGEPLRLIASVVLGESAIHGGAGPVVLGLVIHFVVSGLLGMLFSRVVGRTTMPRTLGLGLLFGIAIWAVSQFFLLPLVNPVMALRMGTVWPFFLAHLGFGLGTASCMPVVKDIDAPPPRVPIPGRRLPV